MIHISDTKDLGAFIRRMRKARGYTQAELAEIAGVGVVYISQLENGKETAEIGKALKLLQFLSTDLEAIDRQNPPKWYLKASALSEQDSLAPTEALSEHARTLQAALKHAMALKSNEGAEPHRKAMRSGSSTL